MIEGTICLAPREGGEVGIFSALPPELAGKTLRRAFPHFYLFVLITASFAAAVISQHDRLSATLLAVIALTTIPRVTSRTSLRAVRSSGFSTG